MSITKVTGMMQTSTKGGDISSASPTVIDTDGDYFDVTGTTNFAAFTVVAGRRFTIQFDGVLTMTHHATNLDLPGGANITTAAGDVGEFFATGTNTVQCVNYTKADGTAVVAAGGGAWNLLSTQTASNSSSLDITADIDSTYKIYKIEITDLVPVNDNVSIYMRMGDSSGFDTGSTDYSWATFGSYSTATNWTFTSSLSDDDDAAIRLAIVQNSPFVGNASGEGFNASLTLNRSTTGVFPSVRGLVFYIDRDGNENGANIFGARVSGITLDRIQIYATSGNLNTGTMSLYGISQ